MSRSAGKISLTMTAGIACSLLFCIMLSIRLGIFQENRPVPLPITKKTPASYAWHEIYQDKEKIGYSHRRVIPQTNGYHLSEKTFMRINTMGLVQDINLQTTGVLAKDMSLLEFTFALNSSRFNFAASGKIVENEIQLDINGQPSTMPVETPLYLTAGIFDAVSAMDIKAGQTRTFNIFDPSSMSQRPIRVTFIGMEKVNILEQEMNTRKLETDFLGAKQTAWVTLEGEVVKETGPLGITLIKSDAGHAMAHISGHTRDLTRLVSVDAGTELQHPGKIKKIVYKLQGVPSPMDLDGGRQILSGDTLTVTREAAARATAAPQRFADRYLQPSPFIQSDHPDITALADTLVAGVSAPAERVLKIKNWLYTELEKRPVLSVPNALETLNNKMGDCNEHAVLFAALARAAGVPARIEAGLVYLKGRFYYHAWNSVFTDRWLTVDSLMGQFPADATHICFTRGGPEKQLDLMGVIGKINLEILDIQYD